MSNETSASDQGTLDAKNAKFWDELCGTGLATAIGVTDDSPASLKRFDNWYFEIYPFLFLHLPFTELKDKKVLEIGLGYGTVAQRIGESGAEYTGLDIAGGPVYMANLRMKQGGLNGSARQGSILAAPFEDNTFDQVVAFGCLHHTGDLQKAIDECWRVLKPGGKLTFMVYYAYSFRRWTQSPKETARYALRELFGYRGVMEAGSDKIRAASDANKAGEAAPHVDFVSDRSLKYLCRKFSSYSSRLENINQEGIYRTKSRRELLMTPWPHVWGLDIYVTCVK